MRTVIARCLSGKQKPAGRTAAIGWIYPTMIASTNVRMITRPCSLTYSGYGVAGVS